MTFINREFSRFVIVGGANTLLGYLIYALALLFAPYIVAYTISYVAGIFISYYLNSRFVFKANLSLAKALQYPLVYGAQYLIGVGLLRLFVETLTISELLAPAFVVACTLPVTFVLSRLIIKR